MALYFLAMYVLGASLGPLGTGMASDYFTKRAAAAAGAVVLEPFKGAGLHTAMYLDPAAEPHPDVRPVRRVAHDHSRHPPAMKAAICYANNEPVRVEDVDLDAPKDGEVLVRMAASGVCHSDRSVISGIMPAKLPASSATKARASSPASARA